MTEREKDEQRPAARVRVTDEGARVSDNVPGENPEDVSDPHAPRSEERAEPSGFDEGSEGGD